MSLPLTRLHKTFPVVVSACCLCLLLLHAGCESDVDAADKQVREHLSEGRQKEDAAVSSAPSVPEGYKKAAGVTNASPVARAEALTRLAEAERDRAAALTGEADRLSVRLLRLISATSGQAIHIQSNNTLITGLTRLEPTQATQAIRQQRAAAQGQEKPLWVEHETGPIPALKGLEEQAAQLQEQIAQLEGQAKDLAAQRSKLIADAEQLERQSEEGQGEQSIDLFNQSVDARRQAADLSVHGEALEAKLLPLRQDLERVQANQQAIAKTVATFGGQLQSTQQSWEKIQEQIAALQQLNQRILGAGGGEPAAPAAAPGGALPEADAPEGAAAGAAATPVAAAAPMAPSITGKLRQVNELVTQIEARRSEAESLLKSAMQHIEEAGTAAAKVVSDLGTQMNSAGSGQRPERVAWQRLAELHNPSRFKLKHATLKIMLADLYRSRAADLAARANMHQVLTAALEPAQLPVPQEAGGANLEADAEAARSASIAQYNEAQKELEEVIQAPKTNEMMGEAAKAAQLMQLVRLYAQAQVDPQTATGLAARARALAAEGDQVELPATALPAFVQDALELRTTPATGPAAPPGTAAPGATTPPAGAETPPDAATPGAGDPPALDAGAPTPPAP